MFVSFILFSFHSFQDRPKAPHEFAQDPPKAPSANSHKTRRRPHPRIHTRPAKEFSQDPPTTIDNKMVSIMFWKCFGNVLEMFWKCFGNVLEIKTKCLKTKCFGNKKCFCVFCIFFLFFFLFFISFMFLSCHGLQT